MRTANAMRRSMRRIWIPLGVLVAAGGIGAADRAAAEGGALYRWESADGTVSFTDDAKRIPERHRAGAATIDRTVLADYGRFTPTDAAASGEQARRLEERLISLRETNRVQEPVRREAARAAAPTRSAAISRPIRDHRVFEREDGSTFTRYYRDENPSGHASLPVDPDGPPVVTEQKRVRVPGQPVTRTIVVTRQGDRVLSVVQERRDVYHTLDFGDMSDYESGVPE